MKKFRLIALTTAPLALALTLTGCADSGNDTSMPGMHHGDTSPSPTVEAQGDFNAADSMFATMMIPHHQQAVEMSDMVATKSGVDQRVLDLAQQIKDAQAPEIELLQSWLDAWGMVDSGDVGAMHHGGGMMSEEDMAALDTATGADAARLFLEQMILHHEGAVEMAQAELEDGVSPDALELAQTIVDTQTMEISTMQDLLTKI